MGAREIMEAHDRAMEAAAETETLTEARLPSSATMARLIRDKDDEIMIRLIESIITLDEAWNLRERLEEWLGPRQPLWTTERPRQPEDSGYYWVRKVGDERPHVWSTVFAPGDDHIEEIANIYGVTLRLNDPELDGAVFLGPIEVPEPPPRGERV